MKKCKVVIATVKSGGILYKGGYGQLVQVHIELRDENNYIVAMTNGNLKCVAGVCPDLGDFQDCNTCGLTEYVPSIPQSFIDEFIASNGSIKEVMVETDRGDYKESASIKNIKQWLSSYEE